MGYKHEETPKSNVKLFGAVQLPNDVDWVEKGAVNTPEAQDKCGGCYAFSSSGALEGLAFINTGKLPQLSKQQILECSKGYGVNVGCDGGLDKYAFQYAAEKGLASESEYPFKNEPTAGECNRDIEARGTKYNTSYQHVPSKNYNEFMAAVAQQPVSVGIDANKWQFYSSGVYYN